MFFFLKKLNIFLGLCGCLPYLSDDLGKSCVGFIEFASHFMNPGPWSTFCLQIWNPAYTHADSRSNIQSCCTSIAKDVAVSGLKRQALKQFFQMFCTALSEPTVERASSFHFWTTLSGLSSPWSEIAFKSFLCLLCGSGINLTVVIYGHLNPMTLPLRAKNNLGVKEQLRPRPKKAETICFCLSLRKSTGSLCLSSSVSFSDFFTRPDMICFSYSEYFSLFYSCCHHFRRAAQSGGQTSASGSGVRQRYDGSFFILPQAE